MTQEQRAEVWQRRDLLIQQKSNIPDTKENIPARKVLIEQIEACNQELISDVHNPSDVKVTGINLIE